MAPDSGLASAVLARHLLVARTQADEDRLAARVVTAIQAGEERLFVALYDCYSERLRSYFKTAFSDEHEAEDATQHVFAQALAALPRYRVGGEPFRVWLFRVARNHAMNRSEKLARAEVRGPADLDAERDSRHGDPAAPTVFGWLLDRQLARDFERLPLVQRQVVTLRYLFDLSYEQIGVLLGRDRGDVRSLNSRAIRFLRARSNREGSSGRRLPSCRMRSRLPVLEMRRLPLAQPA